MQTDLDLKKRIQEAAAKGDFEEVARLAQIASQLQKLEEQKSQLLAAVQPLSSFDASFDAAVKSNDLLIAQAIGRSGSSRGGLTVELTGKEGSLIRISERTAAETMVVLMERILALFGPSGLEKLTRLQVSRGPLISKDPAKDFRNDRQGNLYAHHRVPGTAFYVLTHSDSQQKVKDIKAALKVLGLAPGTFRVFLA